MQTFLKVVLGLLVVVILATIIVLATGPLSSKEAGFLSIILFICSVVVTWVISHIYGESAHRKAIEEVKELHRENLRTYARKAAEKVNNLSNQLNLLSVYLQQELDATDYGSSDEELLVKEERMEAAIQIVNMLKSINDTALSDWQGAIGEELDQQRKERGEGRRHSKAPRAIPIYLGIRTEQSPEYPTRRRINSFRDRVIKGAGESASHNRSREVSSSPAQT